MLAKVLLQQFAELILGYTGLDYVEISQTAPQAIQEIVLWQMDEARCQRIRVCGANALLHQGIQRATSVSQFAHLICHLNLSPHGSWASDRKQRDKERLEQRSYAKL